MLNNTLQVERKYTSQDEDSAFLYSELTNQESGYILPSIKYPGLQTCSQILNIDLPSQHMLHVLSIIQPSLNQMCPFVSSSSQLGLLNKGYNFFINP